MPSKTDMEPRKGVMRGTSVRKSVEETRHILDEESVVPFRGKIDVSGVMKDNLEESVDANTSFGPPLSEIEHLEMPTMPSPTTPVGIRLARRAPRRCTLLVEKVAAVELPKKRKRKSKND
ncbi:unnamed protein product [Bursaphelenchus xylophilus]|uniref:(pine wood nematode) hypothetical protein n=1 Tax=Bursaphelenchus xylophilus TaxID=6326 RepID=A0A1I7RUX0_BURXY|nr:unnamed protein product [Bursaphelenchus xylophilus]CAG9105353.1 unnamed protein product [Bursaphelenchus xylophilus]